MSGLASKKRTDGFSGPAGDLSANLAQDWVGWKL
jgi:hypothetical protein